MELKINKLSGKENLAKDFNPNTLRVIPFAKRYCIDVFGNVISNINPENPKVMKRMKGRDGAVVRLRRNDGKPYTYRVARLVWIVFNGNIPSKIAVKKKNGVKNDDSLNNLYISNCCGVKFTRKVGRYKGQKLVEAYKSAREAGNKMGVSSSTIYTWIATGREKNGCQYRYIEENEDLTKEQLRLNEQAKELKVKVGQNLKELREKEGKNPNETAKRFNLGVNRIYQIEKGEREVDLATLVRMAKGYGVTLDYLCGVGSNC